MDVGAALWQKWNLDSNLLKVEREFAGDPMQMCSPGRLGHGRVLCGLNKTIISKRAAGFCCDIGDCLR